MNDLRPLWPALLLSSAALLLAACDDNHHDGSENGIEPIPATATLSFSAPGATFDLNNYTRVGQYALPVGTDSSNLLAAEASAVTYDKDTDSLYVVGDGATSVVQVSKLDGSLIDSMPLAAGDSPQGTAFYDTEGITYVGGGQFVLVEERYRQANLFTYAAGTTLYTSGVQTVKLGTTIGNIGLEGASYDPSTSGYVFVKEKDPEGVFQTTIDFGAGSASNGSATTENSDNLFDPSLLAVADLADVFAVSNVVDSSDAEYNDLLLLSQESGQLLQADRSGNVKARLDIDLNAQNEGVTMDGDHTLYLVNELGGGDGHPQLWIYKAAATSDAVGVGSNLYLTFTQDVSAGSGYIVLDDGQGDTRAISVTDTDQVTVDGDTVTINPEDDLVSGHTYTMTVPDGAFTTADGSDITDIGDMGFTTVGDILPPLLLTSSPVDDSVAVTSSTITLTFNETVQAGAGSIVITGSDGDSRTIDISDSSQVTIAGDTVTITPSEDLHTSTDYNVQIASGVITDSAGNAYAGLTTDTALNFTMAAASGPTTLAAGDLLFVGANADSPDAIAFILLKDINAGTQIGFTDKDYDGTATWPTNEAAYMWTADQDYTAGTIVTIQPDEDPIVVDKGTVSGSGGGIGASGETYYAFQGTITDADTGDITVDHFLATINVGGSDAGTIPQDVIDAGADLTFADDDVKYTASTDASDITTLAANIKDTSNWSTSNDTPFEITDGSMFPEDTTTPTTLSAGDVLFVGANSDSPDALAFILLKDINAGTQIGFTDKDYDGTATWPTNEAAYMWTADQAYSAGTIVTIQPGTPVADKGTVEGEGGGLSNDGETVYAFQGTITDANNGQITVDRFLSTINVGGAAAGTIPQEVIDANADLTFSEDNALYAGSTDASNVSTLAADIENTANWATSDDTPYTLTDGSLFP
ncbi:SdiA-regulated domain-containing protein [Solimonas marina]|uniref:SbsA Ig-like domain-containing protein n=1 Tax=Solimonas marina TaxID=2714601 RepID=A0A970B772_9GAMM|nr:SdiA-regulated domain-containing protein [Solimonas marina]NKF20919.1 hypothetical protein [Solimonas marina]